MLHWKAKLTYLLVAAAVLACAFAVAGTLRWIDSDAHNISPREAANELAANGLYEFFAANYRNELSYERHYATVPAAEALSFVRASLGAEGAGVERRIRFPRRNVPAPAGGLPVSTQQQKF